MQSIGQRLEEARNRKGISLREAAEATKIRSDFLGYFEQDKFEYDLPEIYRRGFLKNYARYLQLDPEKIITDYDAQQLGKSRSASKGSTELFGQIEIKGTAATAEEERSSENSSEDTSRYGRISRRAKSEDNGEGEYELSEKTFYMKVGLIFAGTLALVFIVFGLIKAILSSDTTSQEPTLASEPAAINQSAPSSLTPQGSTAVNAATNNVNQISLIASGTVYVLVKQKEDNAVLYRDTMSQGETVQLSKNGPVDILFTAGENIIIEHAGERLRPSSPGTAKISIP